MGNPEFWSVLPSISRCWVGVSAPTPTFCYPLQHKAHGRFHFDLVGVSVLKTNFLGKRNIDREEGKSRKKLADNTDTPTFLQGILPCPLCHNDLHVVGVHRSTPTQHRLFLTDADRIEVANG